MRALSFGELLFDVFSGTRRIGGAPLNVAAHLSRIGCESALVSAVGDDMLGKEALSIVSKLGVSTAYIDTVSYETGRADITLSPDGDATYSFNAPAAWDHIELADEDMESLCSKHWDAFVFGTLSSRGAISRETLYELLDGIDASIFFFDVNFRKGLYSKDLLLHLISHTTILKVNEEELPIVLSLLDVPSIDALIAKYSLRAVLLTLGGKGAELHSSKGAVKEAIVPGPVVDTVGAGDSLSAAFLYYILSGEKEAAALAKAMRVASFVCSEEGAVPTYSDSLLEYLSL